MVGKKSGKALLREEGKGFVKDKLLFSSSHVLIGLARTDNGMKQTSWPEVQMINQKNYYTYVLEPLGQYTATVRNRRCSRAQLPLDYVAWEGADLAQRLHEER
jgi:hypothetical protein